MQVARQIENELGFKVYVAGGCVRDHFLGRPVKDVDLVVIGRVETYLLRNEWELIGQSFPVYHNRRYPGVELAIGRKEKKVAEGHNGFTWEYADTIEEDLRRRDFTINAMALESCHPHCAHVPYATIIDPFNGQRDLFDGVLRIVGPHFGEDPLRVFRAARFASQLGFVLAPETYAAMRGLASNLGELSFERVWLECRKAIESKDPAIFFEVLAAAGCLNAWFPELEALIGVPAGPPKHHPEGDTFNHTMLVLKYLRDRGATEQAILMGLTHDFGKALTPKEELPAHHGHDDRHENVLSFCQRFGLSDKLTKRLVGHCANHLLAHKAMKLRNGRLVTYWREVRHYWRDHLEACRADVNGRGIAVDYPEYVFLETIFTALDAFRFDGPVTKKRAHDTYCGVVKGTRRATLPSAPLCVR